MSQTNRLWLIAGPNGVGKTIYALRNAAAITGSLRYVNQQTMARGLSPIAPRAAEHDAARMALRRARRFIAEGEVFSMETTMSGRAHLALMEEARVAGMSPALLYFSVRTPEICLERIARRVAEGGHDVAEDIVRRRFARSHQNLPEYTAAADLWRIYEASGPKPCLAAEGNRSLLVHVDANCLATANMAVRDFVDSLQSKSI